MSLTTTVTSAAATVNAITQTSYLTTTEYAAPTLRARTVITTAKKLKPNTTMNMFISNADVSQYYLPCAMVEIITNGAFIGSSSNIMNDNIPLRTSFINSYDTINVGEVVTVGSIAYGPPAWAPAGSPFGWIGSMTTLASGGSGVVVADETIYDPISNTNKRILYVINTKGVIFPGQIIKGTTSQSSGTVVSIKSGTNITNSLGNMYGAILIPGMTFKSGNNSVLFTDSTSPDPASATTLAYAGYLSNGIIDTYTTTINYQSQLITTITNTITNTTTTQGGGGGGGGGGGPGFLGIFGSGSFFGGGCFITTAMCEYFGQEDDCFELTTMRALRDGYMQTTYELKHLAEEYYIIAPMIVEKLDANENKDTIYEAIKHMILACVLCENSGNHQDAVDIYVAMVKFASNMASVK